MFAGLCSSQTLASTFSFASKQHTPSICPALPGSAHSHSTHCCSAALPVLSSVFTKNSMRLICLVAVLGLLAVTAEATVASQVPGDGSPEAVTGTGQARAPAYPDPMAKRVGANWTCYEGWDVVGDTVYVGPDEQLEYITVSTLQECQAASCPRGVRNYVGEPVNYCIGEFVVFDKTSGQCWRKINWGCGFNGATAKKPTMTTCIQNRPGLLKRAAQCDNYR